MAKNNKNVAKVDFLNMYPMTFSKFLIADNKANLVEFMKGLTKAEKISNVFRLELEEKLKTYFIIGGMPEVVKSWIEEKDIEKVNYLQQNILNSYETDFSKHTTNNEANKISIIWNNIPSQLAKENKKFVFNALKEGARAREYEEALNWLNDANLITKVYNVSKPSVPLKAYVDLDSFKIYMNDIGLLRRMSNLDSSIILEENKLFEEFKGAFSENYALNMLTYINDERPYYFTFSRNEIDFVIQYKNKVIPIEVKSNRNHISLTKYNEKYKPSIQIRLSLDNLDKSDNIINIPLYCLEYINNIIEKNI